MVHITVLEVILVYTGFQRSRLGCPVGGSDEGL